MNEPLKRRLNDMYEPISPGLLIPFSCVACQKEIRETFKEQEKLIIELRLEMARGKGMLVVIGVIAGMVATAITQFIFSLFRAAKP